MRVVNLIGIHGLKGSGKDTVAGMISREVSRVESTATEITHYADRLKLAAVALFGVDIERFYDGEMKERTIPGLNITPRQIMTDLHDVLVPKFGQDLFVGPVRRGYEAWAAVLGRGPYVIADVRYDPRETAWIREQGGVVVHVYRKSVSKGIPANRHSSEHGIPLGAGDYVIQNDGTVEELQESVGKLVKALRVYS